MNNYTQAPTFNGSKVRIIETHYKYNNEYYGDNSVKPYYRAGDIQLTYKYRQYLTLKQLNILENELLSLSNRLYLQYNSAQYNYTVDDIDFKLFVQKLKEYYAQVGAYQTKYKTPYNMKTYNINK